MSRRAAALALAVVLASVNATSAAPSANGPTSDCARQGSALAQTACELARGLPALPAALVVTTRAAGAELTPERGQRLAERLSGLVAGQLGAGARAVSGMTSPSAAQSLARSAQVVALELELDRARLAVTADVLPAPGRFWERFQAAAPRIQAHAFAARPLDAELRSYLPRVPLVISRVHKATLDEPAIALTCGDLDRDGAPELALVGRQRTRIGRLVGGVFRATRSAAWSELSPLAPSPLREPIGTAFITPRGTLLVGTTDRAAGLELDGTLTVLARYESKLPWGNAGCTRRLGVGLAPALEACAEPPRSSPESAVDAAVDAIAATQLVARDGTTTEASVARRQRDARLELRLGAKRLELQAPAGAQLALGDLDGDGRLELVTSDPTTEPERDVLTIHTLGPDGAVKLVLRVAVPSGLRALAVCPPGESGLSPIAAATGDGLWVLE